MNETIPIAAAAGNPESRPATPWPANAAATGPAGAVVPGRAASNRRAGVPGPARTAESR